MKSKLIAACGMNCNLCISYLRDKNKCPGCRLMGIENASRSNKKYCRKCVIRNCSFLKEKNLKFCSLKCTSYPCKRLKDLDKRYKTKYPGVYYINGRSLEKGTKEKVYYIVFRKNGKLIEEKTGHQFHDKMTPSQASRIRDQKIAGKLPLNRDQKKPSARHDSVNKSLKKVDETQRFEIYRESKIPSDQLNKILNAIFRVSTDGLSISDREGNIIACNEASSKITGLKVSDFVGKNVQDLIANEIIDKSVTLEVLAERAGGLRSLTLSLR